MLSEHAVLMVPWGHGGKGVEYGKTSNGDFWTRTIYARLHFFFFIYIGCKCQSTSMPMLRAVFFMYTSM